MRYKYAFTVFTPTFNRDETLHRVFESLEAQTFRDFEWLIIDDGSTDNTKKLVEHWQREVNFSVRYYYQENQGKHIALNKAVNLAEGELFLPWDSDDAAVPEALERFFFHWSNIPTSLQDRFSGVTCLCQDERGNVVGDQFPQHVLDSDELEMPHKYKVKGEKWGFHRTSVLKQFPFPDIPQIGCLPESIVWQAIALQYKKRFINEPLRIYYCMEPRDDRLMSQIKQCPAQHALGRRLCHKKNLNDCIHWLAYDPGDFLRSAVNYARFSLHRRINLKHQWRELTNWKARILWTVAFPFGLVMYGIDRQGEISQNGVD